MSDYFVVLADLRMSRPRHLDKTNLSGNMAQLIWMISLTSLHNLNSPVKTKTVQCTSVPWYNQALQQAKRDRRRLGRLWNRTSLLVHEQMYKEARNRVGELTERAKREHYNDKIIKCDEDQRIIFKLVEICTSS